MQNLRIYQTANNPAIVSSCDFNKALDSLQKEQLQNRALSPLDKVSCLWQHISRLICDSINANMELSESAGEIADMIKGECNGLNVTALNDYAFELSDKKSGARLWLAENSCGEIFLYFLPSRDDSRVRVDITEMGPQTAAFYIGEVFSAYHEVVSMLKN